MDILDQNQIKILLVEDNPGEAFLLEEKLSHAARNQFDLTHVPRLAKAVNCLQQKIFDIILLDLSLPDSQGLETFLSLEKND